MNTRAIALSIRHSKLIICTLNTEHFTVSTDHKTVNTLHSIEK